MGSDVAQLGDGETIQYRLNEYPRGPTSYGCTSRSVMRGCRLKQNPASSSAS
jgi:hypothetical protein